MIQHREARLQWARVHSRWTRQQWQNALFTDEMRACLRNIDGRRRVWRRRGEQHSDSCVQPVTAFGGGSVMVWEGITLTNKTHLIQINRNLNSNRYVAEILRFHVVPQAAAIGNGDSSLWTITPAHTGGESSPSSWLVRLLSAWCGLRTRLISTQMSIFGASSSYRRVTEYSTLADFAQLLQEEWTTIPQRQVSRLVNRLHRSRNLLSF